MNLDLSGRSTLLIAVAIVAILLSIFFSAFETSLTSSDKFKLRMKANKGSTLYKKIVTYIDNYDKTISSILVVINISHALYASTLSFIIAENINSNYYALGILLSGFVMFFVGEMFPKLIAITFKNFTLLTCATICIPVIAIISPLSSLIRKISTVIIHIFIKDVENENATSEDDIKTMAEAAVKTGSIEEETKSLIEHALSFDDKPVLSVMTQFDFVTKIKIINEERSEEPNTIFIHNTYDLLNLMDNLAFSRYPVIDEHNKIIGVFNTKIFLQTFFKNDKKDILEKSLLSPLFINGQMKIDDCLKMLSQNKTHLGFVQDSNCNILGIVTIEDIVEELIGEIDDEKKIKRINS